MIADKDEGLKAFTEECFSDVGEYINRGGEQITEMIVEQPVRTLLFSSLAGFAVGLLLARAFTPEESRYSSTFDSGTAERFGRNLLEKIEHVMPAMLRERLSR